MLSSSQQNSSDQTRIDRDYRIIGWWGMGLATFGLLVLLVSMTSLVLD